MTGREPSIKDGKQSPRDGRQLNSQGEMRFASRAESIGKPANESGVYERPTSRESTEKLAPPTKHRTSIARLREANQTDRHPTLVVVARQEEVAESEDDAVTEAVSTNTRTGVGRPRKLVRLMGDDGKTLSESERKRVRARLDELVKEYGSQVVAARAIGLSQQVISRVLQGDPAGMKVARLIAKHDHVSVYQLLTAQSTPALEKLLRAERERWSPMTMAALRELAKHRPEMRDASIGRWEEIADFLERTISSALGDGTRDGTRKR